MSYKEEVTKAMQMLAEDERVIFIGQTVLYPGSAIYGTLEGIPPEQKVELPVAEDMQMGMSIGLSLMGYIPVSVYPRMDFLILACNQLVNHLDKIEWMSCGQYKPKVIVRTMVGSTKPLYPGPQHCQDHTAALKRMMGRVNVVRLLHDRDIVQSYKFALESSRPTVLVEMADFY